MGESAVGHQRQQALYWAKLVELKVGAAYIRLYRDRLGRRVTAIATIRAIASSTSIAVWAVWREYPIMWGGIIAASQVTDAVKDVFPVAKRHKSASDLTIALDRLFIEAQFEWESVVADKFTDDQSATRLHKLRKIHHDTECQSFKDGVPSVKELLGKARQEAKSYFENTYGVY